MVIASLFKNFSDVSENCTRFPHISYPSLSKSLIFVQGPVASELAIMGSPCLEALEPSLSPCDHDAFHIWEKRESLVIFYSYGVQIHTVLFPNDLQRSKTRKTGRDRDRQKQRDRHIVRKRERERQGEKKKKSFRFYCHVILSPSCPRPHNSHNAMKLWPRNISKWQAGLSLQQHTHIL